MTYNKATQAWIIESLERNRLSQHYIEGGGPVDRDPYTLYTNGDPPKKGVGPLRHIRDDYHSKLLTKECTEYL